MWYPNGAWGAQKGGVGSNQLPYMAYGNILGPYTTRCPYLGMPFWGIPAATTML